MHTETGGLDVPSSTKTHATSSIAYSVHTELTRTELDKPGATSSTSPPAQGPTIAPSPVTGITQVSLQGPAPATALPQGNVDEGAAQGAAGIADIIVSVLGGHSQSNHGASGSPNAAPAPDTNGESSVEGSAPPAQTYYAGASPIVAGSSPVVIDGTTYSLASSGTAFFVNGQQTAIPDNIQPSPAQTYYADNTPIVAGGPAVVVSGTTYSVTPSGTAFFVNGQQTSVPQNVGPAPTTEAAAARTYYISNTPIAAGSPSMVIGGTTYSLAATGTAFFVNGQQSSVPAFATQTEQAAVETTRASASASGSGSGTGITASESTRSGASASGTQSEAPAQQTDSGSSELMLPALGLGAVGILACLL